jgi:CTD kinase subunit gamma
MSSFDPFEARMQFLQLLRKLNASQASIQKVVGFAIKYGSKCGEDLWECVTEECAKVSAISLVDVTRCSAYRYGE